MNLKSKANLLVAYLLAGYPDEEGFLGLLEKYDKTPVDIWEIGFPSANPYHDGVIIQKAHGQVDKRLATSVEYWRKIRKATKKPIWLMAYKKDFIDAGIYKKFAQEGLVDALVIPDCTSQERSKLREELEPYNIEVVGFINTAMTLQEVDLILNSYTMVYAQLYLGKTGEVDLPDDAPVLARAISGYHNTKIFGGFGVKTPKRVKELKKLGFDGAIIGTELIHRLNKSPKDLLNYLGEFA